LIFYKRIPKRIINKQIMCEEPTIKDLYELMLTLSNKIDRIERTMHAGGIPTCEWANDKPSSLLEWARACIITSDHITNLFEMNNNTVNSFKACVLYNHSLSNNKIPIRKHKNMVYVFNEDMKWVQWSDDNMKTLTEEIWKKFVGFQLRMQYDASIDEDMRDLHRKQIIGMQKTLFDIKKKRAELTSWIKQLV